MLLVLSRSNCILILVISNIAISAPVKSRKRSTNESERGFSTSPKILEIQLPLKIRSKEDLLAWSKYVMNLVTSKINFTTNNLRNTPSDKLLPFMGNSDFKSKEMMKKASLDEKRQGLNYPARRLKEPPMQRGDEKVVAYPLPMGEMKTNNPMQDPFGLSTSGINDPIDFGQYANFGNPAVTFGSPFQQSEIDIFGSPEIFLQPPAATYLPLPLTGINIATYENIIDKNASVFEEPAKLQTTKNTFNFHIKPFDNELGGQVLPISINDGLTDRNSSFDRPLLAVPFQALVTITRQPSAAKAVGQNTRPKDHFTISNKEPLDRFPFFEQNYTLTNESGQVNVILNNFTTDARKNKIEKENGEEGKARKEQNTRGKKKKSEKKAKTMKKQKSSIKRQSSVLGDLLRMLGILRKLPKNSTEVSVATPVLSILKGTNSQKIQVAFEDELPNRERRNETFQAQQLNGDDDDVDNGNGNGDDNGDGDEQSENQEDDNEDEEEEEEGGSVQAILELLPLAAPILEELSDPESDVDIAEVLQGAIPLLEGLSDPDEEGGIDIPGVLVPLSQRLSEGPEGEGSDSAAILGPIIQLVAPLIGPLSGPLIGPLSRTSSGPGGKEGSASLITSLIGPLSTPQDPYGQSVLSSLIASITSKLSKELAASAGDSDVKALVSSLVSGVLAGASAGSSGPPKQSPHAYPTQKPDAYYAPTTYGGYGYKPPPPDIKEMIGASIKEILNAFLKLSATSSTSSASLSGASSSSSAALSTSSSESTQPPPAYGAPAYSPPTYPANSHYHRSPPLNPPSEDSPAAFVRRQIRYQIRKFI